MQRIKKTLPWVILLCLWQVLAIKVDNEILIPSIGDTLFACISLLKSHTFSTGFLTTTLRVLKGFSISFLMACALTSLNILKPSWMFVFEPLRLITKSIPNITYMIMAILWCGAEGSVTVILAMILFPMLWNGFTDTLKENSDLQQVMQMYKDTPWFTLKMYWSSILKLPVLSLSNTSLSFGFKVGVMAEILSSVRTGLGRGMQFARINLDTPAIFAYTICILCIVKIIDCCIQKRIRIISIQ